ncbi:hypothetical protein M409DRAFT_58880 [Zasmidium cellare ATCC 36951]|uniref:Uncharacterized protein n=1 Tax=Zasmidium cellare ATCC 36951 TaxID=1080233 RepID=A0A6A6C6D3_ZASCE|nr:uncharacterized protein M409DRAFT_58880 [Zasmidium cellare ATCC 36951]KAF2161808.1 hypothetical protein M409DRAFT_58880 [Zasmidium cellare ATCC 36951]
MATDSNDNNSSGPPVKIEAGPKIDKTTIIWLSVVIALVTIGIIIAFVVLGRRFCCASKKRKNKIDYLDNRISCGAWNGDAPLQVGAEKLAHQSKVYGGPKERLWEITIPPAITVVPSSQRGKYVEVDSVI